MVCEDKSTQTTFRKFGLFLWVDRQFGLRLMISMRKKRGASRNLRERAQTLQSSFVPAPPNKNPKMHYVRKILIHQVVTRVPCEGAIKTINRSHRGGIMTRNFINPTVFLLNDTCIKKQEMLSKACIVWFLSTLRMVLSLLIMLIFDSPARETTW